MAIDSSLDVVNTNIILDFILSNITYLVVILISVIFFLFKFNRKVKITKKIKKRIR